MGTSSQRGLVPPGQVPLWTVVLSTILVPSVMWVLCKLPYLLDVSWSPQKYWKGPMWPSLLISARVMILRCSVGNYGNHVEWSDMVIGSQCYFLNPAFFVADLAKDDRGCRGSWDVKAIRNTESCFSGHVFAQWVHYPRKHRFRAFTTRSSSIVGNLPVYNCGPEWPGSFREILLFVLKLDEVLRSIERSPHYDNSWRPHVMILYCPISTCGNRLEWSYTVIESQCCFLNSTVFPSRASKRCLRPPNLLGCQAGKKTPIPYYLDMCLPDEWADRPDKQCIRASTIPGRVQTHFSSQFSLVGLRPPRLFIKCTYGMEMSSCLDKKSTVNATCTQMSHFVTTC